MMTVSNVGPTVQPSGNGRSFNERYDAAAKPGFLDSYRAPDGPSFYDRLEAAGGRGPSEAGELRLVITSLDTVKIKPLKWEVTGLIPRGKVTLFSGDGGEGKSTVTLALAADVSRGRPAWGIGCGEDRPPGDSLLISCEDDVADTVAPRLLALSADLSRCHKVDGTRGIDGKTYPFSLDHVEALDRELRQRPAVRLVVIDPVSAFVGRSGRDDHRDSEVRALLAPVADLAASYDVAVVIISHFNKDTKARAVHRTLGSVGFVNAVRSALVAAPHPEDANLSERERRRVIAPFKANLSPDRHGLAYRLGPLSREDALACLAGQVDHLTPGDVELLVRQLYRVEWSGGCDLPADELLAAREKSKDGNRVQNCANWLKQFLRGYAWPSKEIETAAKQAGFTFDNLKEAKARLKGDGLRHSNRGRFQGEWWTGFGAPEDWALRPPDAPQTPSPTLPTLHYSPLSPHSPQTG